MGYRGTSPMRQCPPPYDPRQSYGRVLEGGLPLMGEAPLFFDVPPANDLTIKSVHQRP